jgi:hypothetical protein
MKHVPTTTKKDRAMSTTGYDDIVEQLERMGTAIADSFQDYKGGQDLNEENTTANVVDGLFEIANALFAVANAIKQRK